MAIWSLTSEAAGSCRWIQVWPAGSSLCSPCSLLKRLTLDFRDVFGKGFSFDTIDMTGQIHSGVLSTKNMSVSGSAASVLRLVSLPRQWTPRCSYCPDIHIEVGTLTLRTRLPVSAVLSPLRPQGSAFSSSPPNMWLRAFINLSVTKPNSGTQKESGKSSDLRRQPVFCCLVR